jgi:hypothetical protein
LLYNIYSFIEKLLCQMSYSYNSEFFLNIKLITEAIELNRQTSFDYLQYGLDKKLHKKREERYIVNSYELIVSMNKYYVIGNYDKYDNTVNYRINKITNIKMLKQRRKELSSKIELPKHRLEHLYMFSGESKYVKLKFKNGIIDQIIDWFSNDCNIQKINENILIYTFMLMKMHYIIG